MCAEPLSCERDTPEYDLGEVRRALAEGRYEITARVRRHMRRKGWTREDLVGCACALTRADFHKSQQHLSREHVWLDVYRPWVGNERRYLKFVSDDEVSRFVVLSFCTDGEAH